MFLMPRLYGNVGMSRSRDQGDKREAMHVQLKDIGCSSMKIQY